MYPAAIVKSYSSRYCPFSILVKKEIMLILLILMELKKLFALLSGWNLLRYDSANFCRNLNLFALEIDDYIVTKCDIFAWDPGLVAIL